MIHHQRVLITGVAGFVGSHLAQQLVKDGYPVVGIDNLSRGDVANLQALSAWDTFTFQRGDILDPKFLQHQLQDIDVVFHEAALIDINESLAQPRRYDQVNVQGLRNVLEACRHTDVDTFVLASSCAVYGNPPSVPIAEKTPLQPLSHYAVTKIRGEHLCREYYESYGVPTVVLRYFNIYGPRSAGGPYSGVITQFITDAREGSPLTIYGDGSQIRDFIHVDDIVQANVRVITAPHAHGEIMNIGTGNQVTINALARLILRLLDTPHLPIRYTAPRPGDIRWSQANIAKAQRLLQFQPQYTLETGLRALLQHKLI